MVIAWVAVGVVLAAWPARAALHAWREQRAGAVYELPVDYRGVYLRGGAAAAVLLVCLAAGAVWSGLPGGARSAQAVPGASASSPAPGHAPSPAPGAAAGSRFVRTGAAYGGSWWQARIAGGRVRAWVPADAPRRLRVLVGPEELLPNLASATGSGYGGPFALLVGADGPEVRQAARAALPLARGDRGWGILGIGDGAPDAVRHALTEPDRYAAGAGIAGRYAPPFPRAARGARVLLVNAHRDGGGADSALRLSAAAPDAVTTSSDVRDFLPERERFRLVRQALVYLTGKLSARG
jgi:hypothetical protein